MFSRRRDVQALAMVLLLRATRPPCPRLPETQEAIVKLMKLPKWAAARYDDPPCKATLRRWCRDGRIHPPPVKTGRDWLVQENAQLVGENTLPHGSLVSRI